MLFYETRRLGIKNEHEIVNPHVEDFTLLHLHRSYEFIYVFEGTLIVTLDGQDIVLKDGEFILIFPNQTHSFRAVTTSRKLLAIFAPSFVNSFYQQYKNKLPKKRISKLSPALENFICKNLTNDADSYMISACMYAVCSEIKKQTAFESITLKQDSVLVSKILTFIEHNFRRNITLKEAADELGYNYHYLSRICVKQLNVSFVDLLMSYRLEHATHRLLSSDEKIVAIAHDCGFENIRSFNRNFLKTFFTTPSIYRMQKQTVVRTK